MKIIGIILIFTCLGSSAGEEPFEDLLGKGIAFEYPTPFNYQYSRDYRKAAKEKLHPDFRMVNRWLGEWVVAEGEERWELNYGWRSTDPEPYGSMKVSTAYGWYPHLVTATDEGFCSINTRPAENGLPLIDCYGDHTNHHLGASAVGIYLDVHTHFYLVDVPDGIRWLTITHNDAKQVPVRAGLAELRNQFQIRGFDEGLVQGYDLERGKHTLKLPRDLLSAEEQARIEAFAKSVGLRVAP